MIGSFMVVRDALGLVPTKNSKNQNSTTTTTTTTSTSTLTTTDLLHGNRIFDHTQLGPILWNYFCCKWTAVKLRLGPRYWLLQANCLKNRDEKEVFFQYLAICSHWKIVQKRKNRAKVGLALYQISNKPLKYCQIFLNFSQSDQILPNCMLIRL